MKANIYWMPILFVTVMATPALSADMEVKYKVDARDFKKNATANVTITFDVYSDSACSVLVDSVPLLAQDIDSVEQPKLRGVKGASKPQRAYWLREVLLGVSPTAETYVIVTGTGISPIGTACQAQSAAVNVDTIAPGADASVRVSHPTVLSVPTNTTTDIPWSTEEFDNGGLHTGSDVCLTPGVGQEGRYHIFGNLCFAPIPAEIGYQQVSVLVNGTIIAQAREVDPGVTTDPIPGTGGDAASRLVISTVYDLSAGDCVKLEAYQDSGSSVDLCGSPGGMRNFGMIRLE